MRSRLQGGGEGREWHPKFRNSMSKGPEDMQMGSPATPWVVKSWGTSSEREGGAHVEGPKGSTLGCKLYSSDCGGRRVRNRCSALPPYPPPTLQDHVLAVPASH